MTGFLMRETNSLEDAFFLKQDQVLVEKLKEMKKMQETKESLSRVSGIKNEKVLEKLVKLDIHPEIVASLAVVPMIEVAWADGGVSKKEKECILELVHKKNADASGIESSLVERWLEHKPEEKLLEAWIHYVEGLSHEMTSEELGSLKKEILENARAVAEASGGFLGVIGSKISKKEEAMLSKLEKAFTI